MNTKNNNNNNKNKFLKRAIKKYGNKFDYKKVNYINRDKQVTIICDIHGEFKQTPNSHLKSKHGCPKCGNNSYKLNKKEFITKANETHNNIYDYSKVNYVNTTTKVEILCRRHGSFWQEPYIHYSKKTICPKCSIEHGRLTKEEFIKRSKKIHNDIYDYNKVEDFKSNTELVTIVCKKHGPFRQQVRSHIAGNGCKECFLESNKDTKEDFVKKAKEVHGEKYDYSKVKYVNSKTPVEIVCNEHGSFLQRPNSHTISKTGCPICNESKGESSITSILKKLNINFIREYKFSNSRYRYDFYLPELNILIEYDGVQHFKPNDFLGGDKGFKETRYRDKAKNELAMLNNIPLIRLPYTKYNDLENYLISKLKKVYKYWFIINGKIIVHKNFLEVCKFYNLPGTTTSRTLFKELKKVVDFKFLF